MPALSSDYITFQAEVSSSVTNTTIVNTAEATAGSSYAEDSVVTQVRQAGDQYVPLYLELWPPHYYLPLTLRRYPVRLTLDPIPAPSAAHTYQVSWSWPDGIVAPYDHYVLQQSRTPNFLTVTQVWTTTVQSQLINYTYCPYYYRVRADSAADWGVGAWSVVQAAQASPPKPVLNAIPAPDGNGSFTVSWMPIPGYTPDQYVLQESATSDFASVTEWVVTGTSKLIEKGTNVGTWYYRVRADASCWGQGPWSDARSTTTLYYDDFSNSASGWPVYARLVIPETETHYRARYENGHYRIMVDPGGPLIWFHQPDAFAPYRPPTNKYCVETRVRLHKMYPPYDNPNWDYFPFWANGGLVFGANEENTNLYALCVTVGTDALNKIGWMIVNNPTYQFPRMGCNYTPGVKGGESSSLRTIDWHLFQVGVDGDQASVYIDGAYKGTFNMPGLSLTTRVGLIGGDYEVTPTDFHFDFFKVTPNVACGPVP
ncbi:MAG: hypothetical protein GX601_09435, partial [Anaerolineales bacterium]|nr:hypothetical protein [Anaerolineales bacterium]